MSRIIMFIGLAISTLAHADPDPHAVGGWVEMSLDSHLLLASNGPGSLDLPTQQLAVGAQLRTYALGLEAGFTHGPGTQLTRLTLGPTARFELVATDDHRTELLLDATVLAMMGFATADSGNGGPTLIVFKGGLEARHWIDAHLAIGGGVLAQLMSHSEQMASELDIGLGGTVRVTGVF